MAYGVLSTGFALKRFTDIKASVEAELRASFGDIDTDADSVFGQLIGVFSRALAEVWEQSENIYNSEFPSTSEGVYLDNVCSLLGVQRLAATPSTVVVELEGTEATVVNSGTTFSQSLTGLQFNAVESKTISNTTLHKVKITVDTATDATTYSITINGHVSSFVSGTGTTKQLIAAGLRTAINANSLVNADVIASYTTGDEFLIVTIVEVLLENIFSATLGALLSFTELWTPIATEAIDDGATPVPIGSMDTIVTPTFGLNSIDNIVEGTTGRSLETDAELRIRRRNSLNIVAAGTLDAIVSRLTQDIPEVTAAFIFENETDLIDTFGRPPHSFEVVVAALNTSPINLDIANKIWERKPAGIATFGTTSITVVDGNGDNQIVNFTHSATITVYVELSYSRLNSDVVFPTDGETLIKDEILRIGQTLTFGSDLLKQKFEAAAYIVAGVTNSSVRFSFNGSVWYSANTTINPSDFPSFDLARITLIDVTP